jgi:Na+-translocating ferredoxin:NAD+ oxidoreductase RnfG subunit
MRLTPVFTATTALVASTSGYATEYLSVEQAQQAMFPGASLAVTPLKLTSEQVKVVVKKSGVGLRSPVVRVWAVSGGGWFFVDDVLGKHEFITYAVGLDATGAVRGVEILTYREAYGGQINTPKWRAQFTGKTTASPLLLDQDIANITGATLSCRHVMEGVKRVLSIYETALAAQFPDAAPSAAR